tara:strand:+ start:210 stop:455 length:246 start_codon:yes stop_codon:yes gene_type:complete
MQLIFILELSRPGTDPNSDAAMTEQQVTLHGLARRWRWAMRVAARGAGGNKGLMNLSLLRVDALFTEWQEGSGYGIVVKSA